MENIMKNILQRIHYLSIDETYKKLKELDPETGISKWFIRNLAHSNKIKTIKTGCKININFASFIEYLEKGE